MSGIFETFQCPFCRAERASWGAIMTHGIVCERRQTALDHVARIASLEAERDAARAEAGRLRGYLEDEFDTADQDCCDPCHARWYALSAALAASGEQQP